MTRVVGSKNRDEFELDAEKRWARIQTIDRLWGNAKPPSLHLVFRGTHPFFNAVDDAKSLNQARQINVKIA